jgi:hypothetical protein
VSQKQKTNQVCLLTLCLAHVTLDSHLSEREAGGRSGRAGGGDREVVVGGDGGE